MKKLRSLIMRVALTLGILAFYLGSYGGAYLCVATFPKSLPTVRLLYRPLTALPLPIRRSLAAYGWQVYGWKPAASTSTILPKAEPLLLLKDMDLDPASLVSVLTRGGSGSVRLPALP